MVPGMCQTGSGPACGLCNYYIPVLEDSTRVLGESSFGYIQVNSWVGVGVVDEKGPGGGDATL